MDVVNDSIACFFIVGVCLPRVVSFEDQQADMLKNALKTVKHYTENLRGCYFHYSVIVQVILKRSKFIKTILQNTNTNIHIHTLFKYMHRFSLDRQWWLHPEEDLGDLCWEFKGDLVFKTIYHVHTLS